MRKRTDSYRYPNPTAWAQTPESLLASAAYESSPVSAITIQVWSAIARHFDANMSPPLAFPGLERLSERTGLSSETISRHIKILDQGKWLVRMYQCRIRNKSVLDSLKIIPPTKSYPEAKTRAKEYKEKTGKGCTVGLLFYGVKFATPTIEFLLSKGFLHPSQIEGNIPLESHHPPLAGEASLALDKQGESPLQEQQNDNLGMSIKEKLKPGDNNISNSTSGSNFENLPWNQIIGDQKLFFDHGIEEDPAALDILVHLNVLDEKGSMSAFEAYRAQERKWMLHEITVTPVNRLLLKLGYLGYRIPTEIENAVHLLRSKNHGVFDGSQIQSFVTKMRQNVPPIKGL
jgi:hypothetical protein